MSDDERESSEEKMARYLRDELERESRGYTKRESEIDALKEESDGMIPTLLLYSAGLLVSVIFPC